MNQFYNTIKIKDILDEDFVNYKKPSMFIITSICDFKCEKEDPNVHCQNSDIINKPTKNINIEKLINRYINNRITKAVVFGGLEPLNQIDELLNFINLFRINSSDDIVIYTGYTEEEVINKKYNNICVLDLLKKANNSNSNKNHLIIKYGRFKANDISTFDKVLGVKLASSNQYAIEYVG